MSKSSVPTLMPSYYSWLFPHDVMAQVRGRGATVTICFFLIDRLKLVSLRRPSSPPQWLQYANDSKHPQADGTLLDCRLALPDTDISRTFALTTTRHVLQPPGVLFHIGRGRVR